MVMNSGLAVVEVGEKLHIITRRNFGDDLRRHFAGTVRAVDGGAMRLEGYTFVFNPTSGEYRRRPEVRTRIFPIADGQLITNVLPADTILTSLQYIKRDDRLVITDGSKFSLDVNEFGPSY
jgi:hypothetical protein